MRIGGLLMVPNRLFTQDIFGNSLGVPTARCPDKEYHEKVVPGYRSFILAAHACFYSFMYIYICICSDL